MIAGIDLGTTFSVVAHLDDLGRPSAVSNSEGDVTTPSVVLFDGDEVVVRQPDILILEGLNVLQVGPAGPAPSLDAATSTFASYRQYYADRDFVSLSVQRTF